ncbi:MAG: hypothetical protein HQK99_14260 [Nitrospirae bacterium]|nr:hypothetical protein [Nitrospirota bacterium]
MIIKLNKIQPFGEQQVKYTELETQSSTVKVPFRDPSCPNIAVSTRFSKPVGQTDFGQAHYFFDMKESKRIRISFDLPNDITRQNSIMDTAAENLPFHFKEELWHSFCIGPHTITPIMKNRFLVGQMAFNRFIKLDIEKKTAFIVDPELEDGFLSSTNCVHPVTGDVWFASWDIKDTICRISNPEEPVRAKIWRFSPSEGRTEKMWQGQAGDFLHQLNISSDGRYLVLCEMGLRPVYTMPHGLEKKEEELKIFTDKGIIPSKILVLDLEHLKDEEGWRLTPPVPTQAHVEFDIANPHRFYASCHNMVFDGGPIVLFGPGSIYCYDINPDDGPIERCRYTDDHLFRVTTHYVFKHQDKILLGVSNFPNSIYLFDTDTTEIYRRLSMFEGEAIDSLPYSCKKETKFPYSLCASDDGKTLYVIGSGQLSRFDVQTGLPTEEPFTFYKEAEVMMGHLTAY